MSNNFPEITVSSLKAPLVHKGSILKVPEKPLKHNKETFYTFGKNYLVSLRNCRSSGKVSSTI